ncbi:MAG: FecR domain-containing protein, partial [Planctomycetota bacterium]
MNPSTSCSMVEYWIHLSLDGELSPEREVLLEDHLDACELCRQKLAEASCHRELLVTEMEQLSGTVEELLEDRLNQESLDRYERLQTVGTHSPSQVGSDFPSWITRGRFAASLLIIIGLGVAVGWWIQSRKNSVQRTVATLTWSGGELTRWTPEGTASESLPRGSEPFLETQRARVPAHGTASLFFANGTEVQVAGSTRFSARMQGNTPSFKIFEGSASIEIRKSPAGILIETPLAVVRATGTRFQVSHGNSDRSKSFETTLQVTQGNVEIWRTGRPQQAIRVLVGQKVLVNQRSLTRFPAREPLKSSSPAVPPDPIPTPSAGQNGKAQGQKPAAAATTETTPASRSGNQKVYDAPAG